MRICGVELTANDAVICLLDLKQGQFTVADCRVRKLELKKDHTREDLQQFQFAFGKLMADYGVNSVAIKERITKGKFAGGSVSFKLESAIQLLNDLDVQLLKQSQLKATLSEHPLPVHFSDTGLKAFQETAFITAYVAHLMDVE